MKSNSCFESFSNAVSPHVVQQIPPLTLLGRDDGRSGCRIGARHDKEEKGNT
ncbi:MAG: hypothetical protein JXA82_03080 [Sedimentisphaerales bacterium]|nr:hypothetical protein [Sedimentisphaerales bacterium]